MSSSSSSSIVPAATTAAAAAAPTQQPGFVDELKQQSTTALRDLLVQTMRLTAEHLLRLSWIIRVLEERGEDLSDLRLSILPYLRLIAYGQILPEVVVRFAAYPLLLKQISSLPEPDQRRLGGGENVRLVVLAGSSGGEDGGGGGLQFTTRMLDPTRMTAEQVRQAFGKAGLRSDAEQIALLEARKLKPPVSPASEPVRGRVRADRQRGGLVVNRTFVPVADVLASLGDLKQDGRKDEDGGDREPTPLNVPLTEEEHRAIKVAAAQGDTTIGQLIRRALRAGGLI